MQGSPQAASNRIGTLAAAVWQRDLLRARELYALVRDRGAVPDAEVPARLKAAATVSQEVEHAILRDACVWLGVDPDQPVERKRGRPKRRRGGQSQAGEVIELTLEADGTVTGRLIAAFAGWAHGTILAALTVPKLAALLVALRDAELVDDADLLEAYLDAATPDWRERIAEEIGQPSAGGLPDDPWILLGVARGAGEAEIKRAYRTLMRAVHPDTTGLPDWMSKIVNDAHRHIMEEIKRG
jgi:DnaJ domain